MLTIEGESLGFCDGLPRRSFLTIGGLALGGLSLPQILRAEKESGQVGSSHKALIMIFLPGGPPHQDMVDLKPDAPSEVRGEFSPIPTNVSGIQISELMPRVAAMMDKFAIIRSLVGASPLHESNQCLTGYPSSSSGPAAGWPSIGSVLSRHGGPVDIAVPPYVDLSQDQKSDFWNIIGPGYLGTAHAPFRPVKGGWEDAAAALPLLRDIHDGDGMRDMKLQGVSLDRLNERRRLLGSLDRFRREVDARGSQGDFDTFTEQALNVLTSSKLVEALDLEREDPKVRARYGADDTLGNGEGNQALMSRFLMARRAVEAGARCVTCSFAHFDWHSDNFRGVRKVAPLLDQGIAALVEDLHERGLDKDVTVVAWGEFGRTPKINKNAGRDHWPKVNSALLAGGGMRTGQVIGATDRTAAEVVDRPVHMQQVFATMYNNLGIDVSRTTFPDLNGRPQYLLERQEPIRELL
jgi:hypothetical protein